MQTISLYDKHRSAQAVIGRADLTPEDIRIFCESNGLDFHAMGCPEGCGGTGWDDATVFRAATHDFPARGVTVTLDTVLEWKQVKASIGEPVACGGIYQHHTGARYTTICEATDDKTGKRQIVYRAEDGTARTSPWDEFFSVVKVGGRIIGNVTPADHTQ